MKNVEFIRCCGCNLIIHVYGNQIPGTCSRCGQTFNRERENMHFNEYILALFKGDVGSEEGFEPCDYLGFVKSDEFPERKHGA